MDSTNDVHYFHNAKISSETFANNGKLTIETMCDYEHVNEYVDNVISIIKDVKIKGISEHDFENEKNAFIIKLLENNEKISDISKNSAREVAIKKQSFSLASELMKVELLTVNDVNRIINEVFNLNKLFIAQYVIGF